MNHSFKLMTFGCKVNQADSAGLRLLMEQHGFAEAANAADADCLIVNSCAVTAESVRKARQTLRSLRRRCPHALLILTGCWPQAFPTDTFEDADIIVGTKEREQIPVLAADRLAERGAVPCRAVVPYMPKGGEAFSPMVCADTHRTRAFLKIQEGCNQFCSYCIIPYARGRCRSMPLARLAKEAEALEQQGFREIVLTGINLGFFGLDTGESLADAVAVCAGREGIVRVRLGSLEPERMDADMIRRLAACEKLCPQFHLSLQSGCDAVLKRMNRRYTAAQYKAVTDAIRQVFPSAAITTDIIVGFPGETDEDFAETLRFAEAIGFAKIHIFPYSPREGTVAASFADQISGSVKAKRAAMLAQVAERCARTHLSAYVGSTVPVLIEGRKQQNAQSFFQGHTPDGTLVKIFTENDEKGLQNSVICVTIESYADDCCIGRPALK